MKTKLFVVYFLIQLSTVKAQFYGQKIYSTAYQMVPEAICTSASTTSIHSNGFLTGMYAPTNIISGQFFIRKTDASGDYTSTTDFLAFYKVYKNDICNIQYTHASNCYGVSVIETPSSQNSNGVWYALAAVCNGPSAGYFLTFCTLDQSGNLIYKSYYDLPPTASFATKPKITESPSNPGDYYICGSYNEIGNQRYSYILKVNINGTLLWSKIYKSGIQLEAKDLIESPYNSNELVVVGRTIADRNQPPHLNRADDGFFLKLSSSSGAILTYSVYGSDSLLLEHQVFSSIASAASTFGGSDGYTIGGYSDSLVGSPNPKAKGTWMLKLDHNGGIIWNTVISQGSNFVASQMTGVFERFSFLSNQYTYFGGTSTVNELKVIKLNDSGQLVGSGNNEFYYSGVSPTTPNSFPTQLTYDNNGFQVYGTDGNTLTDNCLVSAYFSGESDCSEAFAYGSQAPGPNNIISPPISAIGSLSQGSCPAFGISVIFINNPLVTTLCSTTTIGGASNAKTMGSVGIANNEKIDKLEIYPTTTSGKITVKSETENDAFGVNVIDMTGKIVYSKKATTINHTCELELPLESGIYFINIEREGGQSLTKKLIISN